MALVVPVSTKRLRECHIHKRDPLVRLTSFRKQFQKFLTKQGLKFKLNTKVLSAEKQDGKVIVHTQSAKGDKEESVRASRV